MSSTETKSQTRVEIDNILDPLCEFMEKSAPEEHRDHFRKFLRITYAHMQHFSKQLMFTRIIAAILGLLYLFK